ncbi:MAG: Uma2 family endonuclease [Okeania sp. SIO2G4]|uniref:Uma2 family endonuclease n=1 Tax=unclassified Okeania TaxID=2634635 RepID=UPI0013BB4329|nr:MULTISPECIES: Uma2 family endonuclease [unclassified Okeania]NEP71902.1 Uma2 family endonuclease [Okeania sp. SIO2G5]NEP93054.1 Uma2 family endonuclease [Okeania sp. SIO2F5]NEQ90722.1 Uma2 family endonuclease [Okeania sp. SIO2G4]
MSPSDIFSSEIGVRLIASLYNWVYPLRLGRLFDSSAGFIISDTNLKVPDVSFVHAERLNKSIRYFGEIVPELVRQIFFLVKLAFV